MNDDVIHTRLWDEDPEPDHPFMARAAFCRGYDVFGEMVGQARWVEMLFLLFRGELPSSTEAALLEALAVALANPGPREASVHAAMCGGVGGSTAAACLIAALGVGAGQYGGAREVFLAMETLRACGGDPATLLSLVRRPPVQPPDVFGQPEHAPGFDPHAQHIATPVQQLLVRCLALHGGPRLSLLAAQRAELEAAAGCALAMTGVVAAAFADLGLSPEAGEMLMLILRLPGAAAHALEQWGYGFRNFPFYPVKLENDPGPAVKGAP